MAPSARNKKPCSPFATARLLSFLYFYPTHFPFQTCNLIKLYVSLSFSLHAIVINLRCIFSLMAQRNFPHLLNILSYLIIPPIFDTRQSKCPFILQFLFLFRMNQVGSVSTVYSYSLKITISYIVPRFPLFYQLFGDNSVSKNHSLSMI